VRLSRSDDAAGIAPTVEPALRRELMRPAAFSPLL
jgi:hypothetical protein